jgi:hypothetical protein
VDFRDVNFGIQQRKMDSGELKQAELITKYKSQDIITVIKIRRLEWLGHVIRMDETRSVKKICEGKL